MIDTDESDESGVVELDGLEDVWEERDGLEELEDQVLDVSEERDCLEELDDQVSKL